MIHIIRTRWTDNSILSRKARYLKTELGWTIGDQPDPGAFINYSFPYLDFRTRTEGIPFAGYFTHREDCQPGKVEIWERQAKAAVLRITSAEQYYQDLSQYGATAKITPPLDREKFRPVIWKRSGPVRIGVAGYVYRGGRKGEELVAAAARHYNGKYEFKATGRGWPIPTIDTAYDRLQEFFQQIDVYLCTSTIEGVCYPPLEALACGKKVVVPRGVGVLDDIPDAPGIERYPAGDFNEMIKAIDRVIETKADPADLRETTAAFTIENWAERHAEVFVEYEAAVTKTSSKKRAARRQDRGIFVVAYGGPARKCARRLLNSIRTYMPDTQIAIATDQPLPEADFNLTYEGKLGGGAREAKLAAYDLAPKQWDQVIYLDADTELTESIEPIFKSLESGWEMIFTKDASSRDTVPFLRRNKMPEDFTATRDLIGEEEELVLSGGVWAFRRSPGAKNFMQAWQQGWGKGKYRDQPSMLRAYYQAKVKAAVFGSEWNSFTKHAQENRMSIVKHHSGGTARNHPVFKREAEATVVNISKHPIERAGLLFLPDSPVLVSRAEPKFSEIKACEHLKIC